MRETARLLMELAVPASMERNLKELRIHTDDMTNMTAVMARVMLKAQGGDLGAARLLGELLGDIQKDGGSNINIKVKDEEDRVVFYLPENGRE